jgi:hypothetical protein
MKLGEDLITSSWEGPGVITICNTISLFPSKGKHRVDGCVLSFEKEGSRTVFENCPANWQGFACLVIPSGFLPSLLLYLSLRSRFKEKRAFCGKRPDF